MADYSIYTKDDLTEEELEKLVDEGLEDSFNCGGYNDEIDFCLTEESFQKMIREVLGVSPRYDTLALIVISSLKTVIMNWCNYNARYNWCLFGLGGELFDDTYLKIQRGIKKLLLKNKDESGELLIDLNDFQRWMMKCAVHARADKMRQEGRHVEPIEHDNKKDDSDKTEEINKFEQKPDPENGYLQFDGEGMFTWALRIVLDVDNEIYMKLAWLASRLYYVENAKIDRIGHIMTSGEANKKVAEKFENVTLREMFDKVLAFGDEVGADWLKIDKDRRDKIEKALNAMRDNGKTMGESEFCEFWMNRGGSASVSSWVNRQFEILAKARYKEEKIKKYRKKPKTDSKNVKNRKNITEEE